MLDAWLYLEDFEKKEKSSDSNPQFETEKNGGHLNVYNILCGRNNILNSVIISKTLLRFQMTLKICTNCFNFLLCFSTIDVVKIPRRKLSKIICVTKYLKVKITLKDLIFVTGDFEVEEFKKQEDEADEKFSLRVLGLLEYVLKT